MIVIRDMGVAELTSQLLSFVLPHNLLHDCLLLVQDGHTQDMGRMKCRK